MIERDLYYDNLKGLLIIFVVLCHFLSCFMLKSDIVLRAFVLFIFCFHMPLFIFISGFFSKNVDKCRENAFRNLFLFFVIAQIFWVIFKYLTNSSVYYIHNFLDPGYAIWYIISLFFWRFFLKDIVKLRFALVIAFLISPLVMFLNGYESTLAINKTVGFLIFFLLGYYASPETILKIRRIPKYISLPLILLIFIGTVFLLKENILIYGHIKGVLMHTRPLSTFVNAWQGFATYYGSILLAVVFGTLFIAAVPGKKTFLSAIGSDTLPLYLTHTYFLILCGMLLERINLNHYGEGALCMVIAAAVIFVFSTKTYRRLFHGVYDFLIHLIYPCYLPKKE